MTNMKSPDEVTPANTNPSGWQHVASIVIVKQHRKGWPGVLDALRSALFRSPRIVVPTPVNIGVWVYTEQTVKDAFMIASPMGHITIDEGDRSYETYVNGVQVKPKEHHAGP